MCYQLDILIYLSNKLIYNYFTMQICFCFLLFSFRSISGDLSNKNCLGLVLSLTPVFFLLFKLILHIRLFIPRHPLWMLLHIKIVNNMWRCLYLLIWWWINNRWWKIIVWFWCICWIRWKVICKWIKKLCSPFIF